MRLSRESREFLGLQDAKLTTDVFERHRQELNKLQQQAPKSGPARAAIDKLYVRMADEIVDGRARGYLAAFRRERLIPTDEEIQEITTELVKVAHRIWYGQGHQPSSQAHNDFESVVPRAHLSIVVAVKEMRLGVGEPGPDRPFEYDIALSFAGEDRAFVEEVAAQLRSRSISLFYDRYEQANLWGKDLYVHLDEVYRKRAQYCLMFLSKYYAAKLWTSHERKSAQARAMNEKSEYLLPLRLDDTEIPGMLPTIGYINALDFTPSQIADLVGQKLRGARVASSAETSVGLFMDTQNLTHATGAMSVGEIGRSLLAFAKAFGALRCAWATVEPDIPGGVAIGHELATMGFSLLMPTKRGHADFALFARISEETVRDQVGTFILATGDAGFLDKVMELLVLGHPVHLVASSRALYLGYTNLIAERRRIRHAAGLAEGDFFVHDLEMILGASGG